MDNFLNRNNSDVETNSCDYITSSNVIARLSIPISAPTLRAWASSGRIRSTKSGRIRLYHFGDVQREAEKAPTIRNRVVGQIIGYARVSSEDQTEALQSQIEEIKAFRKGREGVDREAKSKGIAESQGAPGSKGSQPKEEEDFEIITDIGSGVDFNRKGFTALLSRVEKGSVSYVIVADKGRLTRFGFELIELAFRATNTRLTVLNDQVDAHPEELSEDLLYICDYFAAKRRAYKASIRSKQATPRQESDRDDDLYVSPMDD
jgi:predicted site-specific integrase-resolvase